MSLILFASNNRATAADLPDLEPLGIAALSRSIKPMHVFRDPELGKMFAAIGFVCVWRDGRIRLRARCDAPDDAMNILVLDCHERDLHRKDRWRYYRATKSEPVGCWSSTIYVMVPDGSSIFEEHATVLRPASAPSGPRVPLRTLHELV